MGVGGFDGRNWGWEGVVLLQKSVPYGVVNEDASSWWRRWEYPCIRWVDRGMRLINEI